MTAQQRLACAQHGLACAQHGLACAVRKALRTGGFMCVLQGPIFDTQATVSVHYNSKQGCFLSFFFLGSRTAFIASSNTCFNPFCVRALHSTYFTDPISFWNKLVAKRNNPTWAWCRTFCLSNGLGSRHNKQVVTQFTHLTFSHNAYNDTGQKKRLLL